MLTVNPQWRTALALHEISQKLKDLFFFGEIICRKRDLYMVKSLDQHL